MRCGIFPLWAAGAFPPPLLAPLLCRNKRTTLTLPTQTPTPQPRNPRSYLAGDSAETSALTDEFPELAALRDIVFFSKLLLVPAADALPDVRPWRLQDSALQWSFNGQERRLVVVGFAQTLDPSVGAAALAAAEAQKAAGGGFGYRNAVFNLLFGSNVKPRCPPSGANPSVLAGAVRGYKNTYPPSYPTLPNLPIRSTDTIHSDTHHHNGCPPCRWWTRRRTSST